MKANPIVGSGTSIEAWAGSRHLAEVEEIDLQHLVPTGSRAVIVAPHPDDEVLGCGGLLQALSRAGNPLLLISVTDGDASHPGSRRWPVERLVQARPLESAEALRRLQIDVDALPWIRAALPDSAVASREDKLRALIAGALQPGDVVFATWREDGHCDHEAVGRAAAAAASAAGARLVEVPIWAWHWAGPEDPRLPWQRARKLVIDEAMLARKRQAMQAHASQLEGDPDIHLPPVLDAHALERLLRPFEVFFL